MNKSEAPVMLLRKNRNVYIFRFPCAASSFVTHPTNMDQSNKKQGGRRSEVNRTSFIVSVILGV